MPAPNDVGADIRSYLPLCSFPGMIYAGIDTFKPS